MTRAASSLIDQPYDVKQDDSELLAAFGVRLTVARRAAGYASRNAMADAIGVDQNTYSPWERGRSYPSASALLDIRRLLSVTLDWLYFGDARHLTVETFRLIQLEASNASN